VTRLAHPWRLVMRRTSLVRVVCVSDSGYTQCMSISMGNSAPTDYAVREAAAHDVPAIADVLSAAFEHDPVTSTTTRNDSRRPDRLRMAFRREAELYVRHGLSTIVESPDDGALGVGLWSGHDQWKTSWPEQLKSISTGIQVSGISGLRRSSAAHSVMHDNHPDAPHYYLCSLGVRPEAQGRGVAQALFGGMLSRCDREDLPAYLEASTSANVSYYQRYGFTALNEFRYGDEGPTVVGMWREPTSPN
jgi:ribosomal protein S18 acetylase RimI-like enzyme